MVIVCWCWYVELLQVGLIVLDVGAGIVEAVLSSTAAFDFVSVALALGTRIFTVV